MKKAAIIILSLILTMVVGLIGALSCGSGEGGSGPASHLVPYMDTSFTVEYMSAKTMTINMAKGAVFEGHFTVRGGNGELRFFIEDSYGKHATDFITVKDRHDFSFRASVEGFYTVNFLNIPEPIPKTVYLHYRVR